MCGFRSERVGLIAGRVGFIDGGRVVCTCGWGRVPCERVGSDGDVAGGCRGRDGLVRSFAQVDVECLSSSGSGQFAFDGEVAFAFDSEAMDARSES